MLKPIAILNRSKLIIIGSFILFSSLPVFADQLPPVFASDKLVRQVDSFTSAQGKESIDLILNLVGVHVQDGRRNLAQVKELAEQFSLEIQQTYRDELVFLSVSQNNINTESLQKLVAELRKESDGTALKFGLAYTSGQQGTVPSISTDQIVAGASGNQSFDELSSEMEDRGFTLVSQHPYLKSLGVFEVKDPEVVDLMAPSRELIEDGVASFAYPNLTSLSWDTETLLDDTRFGDQWHLRNTGQSSGTVDADADLSLAWDITQGNAGTVIAIHENGGFDTTHPDLAPNIWANPGETASNGVDDDGNGWVDDTLGWDFQGCTFTTTPGCGDNAPTPNDSSENHGTAVAGVAAASGGNALGVSGSCPSCGLMLLRSGYLGNDFAKSLPFGYAQAEGAQIVSNSWSSSGAMPTTTTAINAAATAGVTVLFASGNTPANNCTDPRVGNNTSVLAVSSASNQDRKVVVSSTGNCIDILSPSHRGYSTSDPYTGTLNVTTTDRQGTAGYNNANTVTNCPSTEAGTPPANARDYTSCFGGTSSATPLTAGVVGLIESVNTTITRTQIQNLLQDTADRIEDSVGAYAELNGFSAPASATPTHSNGRMNAFEAVRVAASVSQGGKGGVDVFIRDNRLDWGNTEQPSNTLFNATRGFIAHWRSVDIKVDAPPHLLTAPTTSAEFDAFVDEDPVEATVNKVYVRIRNRGPVTATSVTAKLHWSFAGTALPALPTDFWSAFPADSTDTSVWHPAPAQTVSNLAYSGASIAGTGADASQVLAFEFDAPSIDPTVAAPRHYCVMVVLDSPQDEISESTLVVDLATPRNNNLTHRNLALQDNTGDSFRDRLMVRNPHKETIRTMITVEAPDGWKFDAENLPIGRPFKLEPNSERPLDYFIQPDKAGVAGEVSIIQYNLSSKQPTAMGGFTVAFNGKKADKPDQIKLDSRELEMLMHRLDRRVFQLEEIIPKLEKLLQ